MNLNLETPPAGRHNSADIGQVPRRLFVVTEIYEDLLAFGTQQGYGDSVLRNATEALFRTFAMEFFTYILVGSNDAATAITNDATLTWLDLDANGQTIRARLVGRLT